MNLKTTLTKNWMAKILSLILAIAIWYLIKQNLTGGFSVTPPKAIPVQEP